MTTQKNKVKSTRSSRPSTTITSIISLKKHMGSSRPTPFSPLPKKSNILLRALTSSLSTPSLWKKHMPCQIYSITNIIRIFLLVLFFQMKRKLNRIFTRTSWKGLNLKESPSNQSQNRRKPAKSFNQRSIWSLQKSPARNEERKMWGFTRKPWISDSTNLSITSQKMMKSIWDSHSTPRLSKFWKISAPSKQKLLKDIWNYLSFNIFSLNSKNSKSIERPSWEAVKREKIRKKFVHNWDWRVLMLQRKGSTVNRIQNATLMSFDSKIG